ncbi:hypothetical protein LYSHEL_01640 [Lysobacter helvus]|uniref:DUF429 domain-containing protein n=2 Tax=Lysobacteraceae TaxID=32033 RepID=A0ABN6FQJ8_9GAMM|nr:MULTISPECIES: DUF429 domain-containing protein [Lysobacter]BCT91140.1 hypothetical protein LYSCAS_01640 [Lysobacter caseinilyticus]BCT94293.1 hypothetical protein LYSHEL_01640 [Lysobacter helvus]
MVQTTIIGIDCATEDSKVGLALAVVSEDGCQLVQASACPSEQKVAELVSTWIREADRVLIALDAPLGWPRSLGEALPAHRAGQVLRQDANKLFRRTTDEFIRKHLGKQSLDVGADRIARTAHSALRLLDELRKRTGYAVPLAWEPFYSERAAAIEVYPAATLIAHGIQSSRYKKRDATVDRAAILERLNKVLGLPDDLSSMVNNADALDAAICTLAGFDFLKGLGSQPEETETAVREGWIWVRERADQR